jgi:hypothetical protein
LASHGTRSSHPARIGTVPSRSLSIDVRARARRLPFQPCIVEKPPDLRKQFDLELTTKFRADGSDWNSLNSQVRREHTQGLMSSANNG